MMKKLLVAAAVVVVVGLVGAVAVWRWLEAGVTTAVGPAGAPTVEFVVDKGSIGLGIGRKLKAEGLITNTLAWRYHLRRRGGLNAKAGTHPLSPGQSIQELALALEKAPKVDDVPFAMIEGWRLRDTDAALVDKGLITPGAYVKAARDVARFKAPFALPATGLEGYLYPETYNIVVEGFSVEALIQRQLDTFVERFYVPHRDELERSGRRLHDVVTMASMLEREEPTAAQRPLVAGILWRRIDMKFALGVDATSRYELAEWNDRAAFLKRLRDKTDPYNTRHIVGLPPTPIGAPTVASLLAALRPTPTDFLYYLHDADKVLRPSRNAEEHEALRAKYNVY
jgi:UPF0755 protein